MNCRLLIRVICTLLGPALCLTAARAQIVSGVVNSYYQVTGINTGTNSVTVSNSAGLAPGNRILLIQMQGATINNTNTSSFGSISSIANSGNYEINTICGISGNEVLLKYQMIRSYDVSGEVQLISIPVYNSVTINDTLKAQDWNSAAGTGGVLAIEAKDTVYLNAPVSVNGQGFAGGALQNYPTPTYDCSWAVTVSDYYMSVSPSGGKYYSAGRKGEGVAAYIVNEEYGKGHQANGGGGGNNHNTGGAGGGNYGTGGAGGARSNEGVFGCHGANPGIGGLSLSGYGYTSGNNRIFMGGGGGSGHMNNNVGEPGGNGGGIIIITAQTIVSPGQSILANGKVPYNSLCNDPYQAEQDGGGGGGAGGTIILNVSQVVGSVTAEARGANGSNTCYHSTQTLTDCDGPGGGGGGGVIWIAGGSIPVNLTTNVSGGVNGIIAPTDATVACQGQPNGATPGTAGGALTGYSPPVGNSLVCIPLAVPELLSFSAKQETSEVVLSWEISQQNTIRSFELESSVDQVHFRDLTTISANGSYYSYVDRENFTGSRFYRLKLIHNNGSVNYSEIVSITRQTGEGISWTGLQPNPARDRLKAVIFSSSAVASEWSVWNAMGERISSNRFLLQPGYNNVNISLETIPEGSYWLRIHSGNYQETRKFIHIR